MVLLMLFGVLLGTNSIQLVLSANRDLLGPATVTLKYVQDCDGPEKYPYAANLKYNKHNRTHESFSFNISIDFDLDKNTGMHINVGKWGDGGFKPNFFVIDESSCCDYFMKWAPNGFKRVLRELDQPERCPVKGGNYALNKHYVFFDFPPVLLYGRYEIFLYIMRNSKKMGCVYATGDVTPKNLFG